MLFICFCFFICFFFRVSEIIRFCFSYLHGNSKSATFKQNQLTIEAVVQRCSCKKGVLRNFAKFTGKHLCQGLYFDKVGGVRPVTLLKKRLWHRCFRVNFVKFLRTPFSIEHLRWLLL